MREARASVSVCLGLYRPGPGTAFGFAARKRSADELILPDHLVPRESEAGLATPAEAA